VRQSNEFIVKILGQSKHALCNHITLNAGEPVLNLIELRRIGGGVMNLNVRVIRQEGGSELATAPLRRSVLELFLERQVQHSCLQLDHRLLGPTLGCRAYIPARHSAAKRLDQRVIKQNASRNPAIS
jgi:hypothetical protein